MSGTIIISQNFTSLTHYLLIFRQQFYKIVYGSLPIRFKKNLRISVSNGTSVYLFIVGWTCDFVIYRSFAKPRKYLFL